MMATMDLGAQGVTEEATELADYIKEKIWQDPIAADLQWSLFLAALKNYKYDSLLRPFPPMYIGDDDEKDLTSLHKAVDSVPVLSRFCRDCYKQPTKLLELIKWVLDARAFTLTSVGKNEFSKIRDLTGHTVKVPEPNYIFEVTPSIAADEKFLHLQNNRDLMYAYHGSRLENFHSILHNGLASHMNKTSVFGEGTYLSSELSVSMIYSPTGVAWDHSELGNRLSCIAVCEMIDDDAVKCQNKPYSEDMKHVPSGTPTRSRANAGPSEGGNVPEKYYVVQNNEVLRVKYLLVYAEKTVSHRSQVARGHSWIRQYKFSLIMFGYFIILCAIGLYNSQTCQMFWRRIWRSR
ncbi:Protein mono-ADP-ribosyltransferase parp16 [Mactra antiquata]